MASFAWQHSFDIFVCVCENVVAFELTFVPRIFNHCGNAVNEI